MKKYIIGIVATIIGIGGAAFTRPKIVRGQHPLTNNNYRFTKTSNADDSDPANYVLTTSMTGCDGGGVVCIINSPGPSTPGSHPSFALGTDPYDNDQGVTVVAEKP